MSAAEFGKDRGRNGDFAPPPAQTRTGPIRASGVPSLVWWNFPMTLSGDFDGSLSGGEVKRLSELSTERAPTVDLP